MQSHVLAKYLLGRAQERESVRRSMPSLQPCGLKSSGPREPPYAVRSFSGSSTLPRKRKKTLATHAEEDGQSGKAGGAQGREASPPNRQEASTQRHTATAGAAGAPRSVHSDAAPHHQNQSRTQPRPRPRPSSAKTPSSQQHDSPWQHQSDGFAPQRGCSVAKARTPELPQRGSSLPSSHANTQTARNPSPQQHVKEISKPEVAPKPTNQSSLQLKPHQPVLQPSDARTLTQPKGISGLNVQPSKLDKDPKTKDDVASQLQRQPPNVKMRHVTSQQSPQKQEQPVRHFFEQSMPAPGISVTVQQEKFRMSYPPQTYKQQQYLQQQLLRQHRQEQREAAVAAEELARHRKTYIPVNIQPQAMTLLQEKAAELTSFSPSKPPPVSPANETAPPGSKSPEVPSKTNPHHQAVVSYAGTRQVPGSIHPTGISAQEALKDQCFHSGLRNAPDPSENSQQLGNPAPTLGVPQTQRNPLHEPIAELREVDDDNLQHAKDDPLYDSGLCMCPPGSSTHTDGTPVHSGYSVTDPLFVKADSDCKEGSLSGSSLSESSNSDVARSGVQNLDTNGFKERSPALVYPVIRLPGLVRPNAARDDRSPGLPGQRATSPGHATIHSKPVLVPPPSGGGDHKGPRVPEAVVGSAPAIKVEIPEPPLHVSVSWPAPPPPLSPRHELGPHSSWVMLESM